MGCRVRRRLPLIAALALAAGAIACASVTVATAAQVGVNVTNQTAFSSPKALAAIRASKPAWVRVFLDWNFVEPQRGTLAPDWMGLYKRFFRALPRGTKIDVDVVLTPPWASGSSSTAAPPQNDADFAWFLQQLVTQFHNRVTAWEIWNEESSPNWWSGSVSQYADLVKSAYPAIKSVDPKATVILGANSPEMLSQLYSEGIRNYFDADAIHTDTACNVTSPYIYEYNRDTTVINRYFFLGFTGTHALMAANGDGSKPIYMTEIGWSSTSAECSTGLWAGKKLAGVTEQTQATYLSQAYHCLAQPKYSYIKAAMWFELQNSGSSSQPLDNYGLLNPNFSPKPAYDAFKQVSLHGAGQAGSCGNFAPPKITILRPTPGSTSSGPLHIAVSASSPANGVREITVDLTRSSREHFGPKRGFPSTLSASLTWLGAKNLKPGPHKIKVVVIDKLGNVATKVFRITHVRAARVVRHKHHR